MRIATAVAVIASIFFVGWARHRLIMHEESLQEEKQEMVATLQQEGKGETLLAVSEDPVDVQVGAKAGLVL